MPYLHVIIMKKNKYDYIILGGGCSGLSLAYHLNIANRLNNKKLCIVEKRKKYHRDKIWSFWNFEDTQFNDCKLNTWKSFRLRSNNKETIVNCEKFPYVSIDSNLYYNKILSNLRNNPNISFFNSVNSLDLNHGIVFNSIPSSFDNDIFYQHFHGIEIITKEDCFDPNQFSLMDFTTPNQGIHFFYTLPFNARKALIETTWISKNVNHTQKEYTDELNSYLKNEVRVDNFEISYSENGCLPLHHTSRKTRKNEIFIGAPANMIRKSTGYTFLNIQEHSKYIVDNIDNILSVPIFKLSQKYNFYDDILFRVIENNQKKMPEIFRSLFSKNTNSVIKFLSGKSNLINDIQAIMNLPKTPFLKALIR